MKNSNTENPLVSIIVITYNSSKFVLETLESAKAQTYQNIELIVSDDCSTDNTVGICREWLENNETRFVRTELITVEKNTGIPANCNRGVKAAKGEWVKFIAGDDELTTNCLERYISFVRENPEVSVLFSNVSRYIGNFEPKNQLELFNTRDLRISSPSISASDQFEILLRTNKVWAGSLFFSKTVFQAVGYFDESLRLWEDRPMLLKITKHKIKIHYVDFISSKYRISEQSVQRQYKEKLITPFYLEKERYYLNNYLKYLPIFERIVRGILIYRILLIDILGLNSNNVFSRGIFFLTSFPWSLIEKYIKKKYI